MIVNRRNNETPVGLGLASSWPLVVLLASARLRLVSQKRKKPREWGQSKAWYVKAVGPAIFLSLISIRPALAQVEPPQCAGCKNACVNARASTNIYCCTANGGKLGAGACLGWRDEYANCLARVADQESSCLARCTVTVPNCR